MADNIEVGGGVPSEEDVAELNKGLAEGGVAKEDNQVDGTPAKETEHDEEESGDESSAKRDEELEAANTDADREAIRARRREERSSRNQRRRERIETLERTNEDLRTRFDALNETVASLQQFNTGVQMAQLDNSITEAVRANEYFKTLAADATTKGDGRSAVDATEKAAYALQRANELADTKKRLVSRASTPTPADPTVARKATEFMNKNTWFKGAGSKDQDSRMLATLDDGVINDGFDPKTDAYWEELESRGKKYLPHRFSTSAGNGKPENEGSGAQRAAGANKQPVPGASGNRGNQRDGKESYTLSAARVSALKEAGMWDDPAKRAKMIKNYKDADAKAANS